MERAVRGENSITSAASPSPAVAAAAGGSGDRVNRRAFVSGLGAVLAAPRAGEAQRAELRLLHRGE
jgi:hypothetical protein